MKKEEFRLEGTRRIDLEAYFRNLAREEAERVFEGARETPPPADFFDERARRAIQEQILLSHKSYLTRREAAMYLSVSERSIAEWSARPANQNPFPESYAGGEPRYRRTSIEEWAEREGQRRRLKLAG